MVMQMHCPDCLVASVANTSQTQSHTLLLLSVKSASQMSILRESYARHNSMSPSLDPSVPNRKTTDIVTKKPTGQTLGRLWERFYWPAFHTDVKLGCQSCADCAEMEDGHTKAQGTSEECAGRELMETSTSL